MMQGLTKGIKEVEILTLRNQLEIHAEMWHQCQNNKQEKML
jgi:hypothetical protein